MKRTVVAVTVALALVCGAFLVRVEGQEPSRRRVLFRDDFSRLPAGWLSAPVGQMNGAIQEYHYLAHRGVATAPWESAIVHLDAWLVSDEEGKPYLEQQLVNADAALMNPIFVTGDPEWSSYAVEVKVKPLSAEEMAGVVFRYHTNRHYYLFSLQGGKEARLSLRLPLEEKMRVAAWRELARAEFSYDTLRYYTLRVETEGARIRAFVDGREVLRAEDSEVLKGRAGLTANIPARFQDFEVTASEAEASAVAHRIAAREAELRALRDGNPRPRLWKKFATPGFGAGRNVRFGDLDGDGVPEMLFGQSIRRVRDDRFVQLSCLTAVTLDGKVLWQSGKPDPRNTLVTNDTPFQIHDVDGDGRSEVVLVRDFSLQVLDGRTGRPLRSVSMPPVPASEERVPYALAHGDSIAFLDLTGKGRREILVKDRYKNFWVFDSALRLLFKGEGMVGHYPFPFDVDGDGRQEFAIGYALWGPDGKQRWSRDAEMRDHVDGVAVGNFSGDPKAEPRVYACGSDEGYLIFSRDGKLLKQVRIGHAQSPSVGRYRPDLPGLQLLTVNFWKNPGIVTLFDHEGNILAQEEPIHSGSPLLPVNWRGDGQEFAMLSGNAKEGGMIDGRLRRVVMFPDDGHPDLAFNVLDLTGDARDEIVLWDTARVWIYTQDRPFAGNRIYAPVRNPLHNESNYQATVSLPRWIEASRGGGSHSRPGLE